MTLEEMRAALGPVGKAVAGAVEVGVVTAGSYLSGGAMGYVGGGLFGMGALFRPADSPPLPRREGLGRWGWAVPGRSRRRRRRPRRLLLLPRGSGRGWGGRCGAGWAT